MMKDEQFESRLGQVWQSTSSGDIMVVVDGPDRDGLHVFVYLDGPLEAGDRCFISEQYFTARNKPWIRLACQATEVG
jgi:hypothetical protein